MFLRNLVLTLVVLGSFGLAVEDSAPQSDAIDNRQSTIADGPDAVTIPRLLSYQGKLTDTGGNAVPDTTYSVAFRLYTVPSGGTQFWTETQTVRTKTGLFSVLLGSVTPIGSMPDAGAVYLGMAVAGGAELTPRLRIASAAYAYLTERAANADLLQGRDTTTFSRSNHLHDATYVNEGQANSVTGAMLVDATVRTADLGDTAVTMPKLARAGAATGEVVKWTGSAWAPGPDNTGGGTGVTNVYQDTGITCVPNPITTTGNVKLNLAFIDARYVNEAQANSITSAMITDANVTSADIRDTTVSTADIKDAAVTAPKLNQMGATTNQVLKWTGSAWAPRNDSVGGGGSLPDSVPGSFAVSTDLRVYGKGRIGLGNSNAGNAAFVAGEANTASANYSSVSGGADNSATGVCAHISGGGENRAAGDYSTVGGGGMNYASGGRSAVVGGSDNEAYGLCAAIGGGLANTAGDAAADTAATVAGGYVNVATGRFATVGGGHSNLADTSYATVAGGRVNNATGYAATVGGGWGNAADATSATVGGGYYNDATGLYATVGGGYYNDATGLYATVGGGNSNDATGLYATVGGGNSNDVTGYAATIGGGYYNEATGDYATVGGGYFNAAETTYATVAGGMANDAAGRFAAVGGGWGNSATGMYASIGGGVTNRASGYAATVPGGSRCAASGSASFAAGSHAKAGGDGSFVWSDDCSSSDSVKTTTDNRWVARARGGVYFYTNLGMTTGAYLAPGSNSWESACDSMTKEDFRSVDRRELLDKVASLRVRDYKMKDQNDGTRHIGPVAQDFHNAFGYGGNETSINLADADGVLLAAVQALYEQNQLQQAEIEALKAALAERK